MRHERFPSMAFGKRPVTSGRLAAASRALKRERDRLSLFSAEVAAEQPTADKRISECEVASDAYWQRLRDYNAAVWRRARQVIASDSRGSDVLSEWQRSSVPGSAEYLADMLWTRGLRTGP